MKVAKVLNVEAQFTGRVKSIQAQARVQDREYVLRDHKLHCAF
ncbi:MAG: hypothetical protein QM744_02125 [Mesorhizobium sp.]